MTNDQFSGFKSLEIVFAELVKILSKKDPSIKKDLINQLNIELAKYKKPIGSEQSISVDLPLKAIVVKLEGL